MTALASLRATLETPEEKRNWRDIVAGYFEETRGSRLASVTSPAQRNPEFFVLNFENGVHIRLNVVDIRTPPPVRVNFWRTNEGERLLTPSRERDEA